MLPHMEDLPLNHTNKTMLTRNHVPSHYETQDNIIVTIIRVGIAHSFYVVPFSLLAIKKLNNDSNCHTQSHLLISQNVPY